MSGQRAQSAVPADHRSVHPRFAGVPWWGAVLIAVTATAIGFAFDAGSGNRELSSVFAVCYSLGCLLAVLAVQHAGLFTAVIQPPLILFVAVPGSYFLFHGGQLDGMKDLAINCGYPLIERFPLMLFLSAAVLLIGLGRWYVGLTSRREADTTEAGPSDTAKTPVAGIVSSVTAKLSALVIRKPASASSRRGGTAEQDPATDAPPRRRPSGRPPRRRPAGPETGPEAGAGAAADASAGRARGERRPTKRGEPPRPRPRRTVGDDFGSELDGAIPERPRRPRPPRPAEPGSGEPRRRVRAQPREPRRQPPPERRSDTGSFETPRERPQRPRRRFDDFQPFEDSFEPPNNGSGRSTHHPVSRVRYRGSEDDDHRAEHRTRPRPRSAGRGRHTREYDD